MNNLCRIADDKLLRWLNATLPQVAARLAYAKAKKDRHEFAKQLTALREDGYAKARQFVNKVWAELDRRTTP